MGIVFNVPRTDFSSSRKHPPKICHIFVLRYLLSSFNLESQRRKRFKVALSLKAARSFVPLRSRLEGGKPESWIILIRILKTDNMCCEDGSLISLCPLFGWVGWFEYMIVERICPTKKSIAAHARRHEMDNIIGRSFVALALLPNPLILPR